MKTMKVILALLLTALLLLGLCACSFSNLPLIKAAVDLSACKTFRVEPELTFDMQLTMPDFGLTMDLGAGAEGRVDVAGDPTRLSADLTLHLLDNDLPLLAYGESRPEGFELWYSLDEGETWEHSSLKNEEESEAEADTGSSGGVTDLMGFGKVLGDSFRDFVKAGTEEVKGSPATRYDASFSPKALNEVPEAREAIFARLAEALEREPGELEALLDLGSLDDIPLSLWLDQKSGRLVKVETDLGPFLNSLFASGVMKALLAEQMDLADSEVEIRIGQARLSATLSEFNALDPADFRRPTP